MKILVIGDFHGKFSEKLRKLVKREKIDLVVSVGDFFPFSYRELFFKHSYEKDVEVWDVVGKKKLQEVIKKDLKKGEEVLKKLDKIGVPVFTVIGNLDYASVNDSYDEKASDWKWVEQDFFSKIVKKYKNIHRFDYKSLKFEDFVFIGAYGHTFPGKVKSKNYKKYRIILDKLFKKFSKENKQKKVIFVSHNMPYDCKLDKIKSDQAERNLRGKHYGSKMVKRIINRYKPVLHFGGHFHENQGKDKIGKTVVVNPGAALDNKSAVVEISEKGIRTRFIR